MEVTEILKDAIQGEQEAHDLYTRAVDLVQAEHIKTLLRELAQEELGHKQKLENMLADPRQLSWQVESLRAAPAEDYQVSDHLVARPLGPDADFQDVCIFAARREQESYTLYRELAAQSSGPVRELLEAMAQDELRHKNLVERWYEEVVYQDF